MSGQLSLFIKEDQRVRRLVCVCKRRQRSSDYHYHRGVFKDACRQSLSAEFEAVFNINTLEIIVGELPTTKQKLVEAWALIHHKELAANANRIKNGKAPLKIQPLK